MTRDPLIGRLGLNVPCEWWPAASMLKGFEAAGFGWTQLPAPPAAVLSNPRDCATHARAAGEALATTGLGAIVHGPTELLLGSAGADRAFEGLLSYAADAGAATVVHHARDLPDAPSSEDLLLAETRSLARLASRAERLGVTIALENLGPVYPGPDLLSHTPIVLRSLAQRVSSPAVGLCLDLGHAHVVADLRHTDAGQLVEPALDLAVMFHVHDNFGARRDGTAQPELDPLRLDLHLPPGRGTVPWADLSPLLSSHEAPLILEVHPPHRGTPAELFSTGLGVLTPEKAATATA